MPRTGLTANGTRMPDNDESMIMLAAQKAVQDLQVQVTRAQASASDAKAAAVEAQKSANEAKATASKWKRITQIAVAGVLLALAACGFSVYLWFGQSNASNQLRQQNINSCEGSNDTRAAQIQIWDTFVGLLEGKHPSAATQAAAKAFENEVAQVEAPRDCQSLFSTATPGVSPSSVSNLSHDAAVISWVASHG